MEKALFIEGDVRLFGFLFLPEPAIRKTIGFVVIHPFAEEKKSSHRTLVELSRALYKKGFPVLMFDLRGCGDSEGDFASVRLSDWITDIDRAIEILKKHTGLHKLGIIGLRLGAYLSMSYIGKYAGISECIWIEPVLNPSDYLRKSLRHKLMKELCTDGVITSHRDELIQNLRDNTSVDFDGYEIGAGFYRDLVQAQENQDVVNISQGLIISVAMTGKMSKTVQQICALYPAVEHYTIKMEHFWNKVEEVDNTELISELLNYISKNY